MQGSRDPGAIVVVKVADTADDLIDLGAAHFCLADDPITVNIARDGRSTQVKHDLQEFFLVPIHF
jgi:hypothetical protein